MSGKCYEHLSVKVDTVVPTPAYLTGYSFVLFPARKSNYYKLAIYITVISIIESATMSTSPVLRKVLL